MQHRPNEYRLWLNCWLVFALFSILPAAAAPMSCEEQWDEAAKHLVRECKPEQLKKNEICLANDTVELDPSSPAFSREGDTATINESVGGFNAKKDPKENIGFASLTLSTAGNYPQRIIMIAFGNTTLTFEHDSRIASSAHSPSDCQAVKFSSGDSYIRKLPTRGQVIGSIKTSDRLNVLGKNAGGDALLVQREDRMATGWVRRSEVAFYQGACPRPDYLTIYPDSEVIDRLRQEQNLDQVSRLTLTNRPADPSEDYTCSKEAGIPPSGLLILNSTGQVFATVVNDYQIYMKSSVLITQFNRLFSVYVLEGEVLVRDRFGREATANAGSVVIATPNAMRRETDSGTAGRMPWCNRLRRLAIAAFGGDRARIPLDRFEFCRFAPEGYPVDVEIFGGKVPR